MHYIDSQYEGISVKVVCLNQQGMPPNLYSLLLASMSSGQGMPFPPQLLAGFPGMQTGGMGFLGPLANPASLQSLLSPEVMQHFQQVRKFLAILSI